MDGEEFGLYVSSESSPAPDGQEFVLPSESRATAEAELSAEALGAYWREEAEESDLFMASLPAEGGGATSSAATAAPGKWQLDLITGPSGFAGFTNLVYKYTKYKEG